MARGEDKGELEPFTDKQNFAQGGSEQLEESHNALAGTSQSPLIIGGVC